MQKEHTEVEKVGICAADPLTAERMADIMRHPLQPSKNTEVKKVVPKPDEPGPPEPKCPFLISSRPFSVYLIANCWAH
jgi:hypothetical protein